MKNKGFTLIEILVAVLIIGILAAVAVPQYQKAVMKSDLHIGVNLVESLYQAQQSYFLTHGAYATNIDELDINIPKNASCQKTQNTSQSFYKCDFGTIGLFDKYSNIQFQTGKGLAYLHFLTDLGTKRKAGERWCFASPQKTAAQAVCQNIGGVYSDGTEGSSWIRYKLN